MAGALFPAVPRRRWAVGAALLVGVSGGVLLLRAAPARPAVSCAYDGVDTVTVRLDAAGDAGTLSVGTSGAIRLGDAACDDADITNTTRIVVRGRDGGQTIVVDRSGPGGAFPNTIAFDVDLRAGTDDTFVAIGTGKDDAVQVRASSATMPNAVTLAGVEVVAAKGGGGDDVLDASAWTGRIRLNGGPGSDRLVAGDGGGMLRGGPGNDALRGGDGGDRLRGGSGADRLSGADGKDTLRGDGGDDTLLAGPGNDDVFGGLANDALRGGQGNDILRAGPGNDVCFGGPGEDGVTGCEQGGP